MSQTIISAGDAVVARLIEEAGFDGIWVSGFEASARLGLPDNGSITMHEMLNITKPIVDAVKIPVYVDVDTGYGNFKRTVKEFERIGVKGICVEDNLQDKENSLWGGERELLDIEEFAEKINIPNRKIEIIARTEALIRGKGLEEAVKRASRYTDVGADFVLIHTRDTSGKELEQISEFTRFMNIVIVPTKFPQFTNTELNAFGFKKIIWANQTERVKIKAIRECLTMLDQTDSMEQVEVSFSATLDDMRGLMNEE